jgi:hypothetical protein
MRTPTLSEQFWSIVDANWSYTQIMQLVSLCKCLEARP